MSAYAAVQAWIMQNQDSPFFPPLDESGRTSFVEGRESAVFLFVHPQSPEEGEDPIYLYMPIQSLVGVRDVTLLECMIELAEANMIGLLPSGYRYFYDREDLIIYLGGQFPLTGLDERSFRDMVENFSRYGRLEIPRFSERLAELLQKTSGPDMGETPSHAAATLPDSDYLKYAASMLKV